MCINLFSRLKVTFVTFQQDYTGIIWNPITDNHIMQFIRVIQFKTLCVCVCVCVLCGNVDRRKQIRT